MSKFLGLFRGPKLKDVGNQAVLTDYGQIFKCLALMLENNNTLQNLYQSLRKNMMYGKEKLQYSEDLIEMIAEKFEGVDELLERIGKILHSEEEVLRQKKEMLRKIREDIADSKFRLLSMGKPELEKYMKLAEDRAAPCITGFVREEREELEHRLLSATVAVNEHMDRNLDDVEACESLKLYRERLQEEHHNYMLVILNEFGDLKKKRTFLLRSPVFNENEGKKDLMQLFRIPREEFEVTRQENSALIERNEGLTERIREQRLIKSDLQEGNTGILEKLLQEKDVVVRISAPYKHLDSQNVGLNVISV